MPGCGFFCATVTTREAEALRLFRHARGCWVIVGEDDHFVAGLQVEAVRDQVVRLAGVAGDDDLFGRDAQELGERLAGLLLLGISRARLTGDGSASTVCVSRVRTSTTGRDAGQRLAAFMTEDSTA